MGINVWLVTVGGTLLQLALGGLYRHLIDLKAVRWMTKSRQCSTPIMS
jgi:hypothetical protein